MVSFEKGGKGVKSMHDYTLHDSGERQQFATGAVRDRQAGKGRFDLLPALAVTRLAGTSRRARPSTATATGSRVSR